MTPTETIARAPVPETRDPDRVPPGVVEAVAHVLLMGHGVYATPKEMAEALMLRLAHEGFAVVPREPTEAMLADGVMTLTMPWSDVIPPGVDPDAYIMGMVWAAMLAAAPAPPEPTP